MPLSNFLAYLLFTTPLWIPPILALVLVDSQPQKAVRALAVWLVVIGAGSPLLLWAVGTGSGPTGILFKAIAAGVIAASLVTAKVLWDGQSWPLRVAIAVGLALALGTAWDFNMYSLPYAISGVSSAIASWRLLGRQKAWGLQEQSQPDAKAPEEGNSEGNRTTSNERREKGRALAQPKRADNPDALIYRSYVDTSSSPNPEGQNMSEPAGAAAQADSRSRRQVMNRRALRLLGAVMLGLSLLVLVGGWAQDELYENRIRHFRSSLWEINAAWSAGVNADLEDFRMLIRKAHAARYSARAEIFEWDTRRPSWIQLNEALRAETDVLAVLESNSWRVTPAVSKAGIEGRRALNRADERRRTWWWWDLPGME